MATKSNGFQYGRRGSASRRDKGKGGSYSTPITIPRPSDQPRPPKAPSSDPAPPSKPYTGR